MRLDMVVPVLRSRASGSIGSMPGAVEHELRRGSFRDFRSARGGYRSRGPPPVADASAGVASLAFARGSPSFSIRPASTASW